ncbi:hypothetical protein [Nonomuraea sp. NPDC048826]|uniref:hypothetical protein n=1 Tax=Nonomuraea sp. NPDC048826 TaxID=3364347 RepID=UPI0037112A5F
MGWNTSALFVRDRSIEEVAGCLADAAYAPGHDRASADQAWSGRPGRRLYLAESGGWCQLWDPDQRIPFEIESFLKGTRVLAVVFAGVSSVYGFWLYDDGELVRGSVLENGEPVVDLGEPLPVEARVRIPEWGPDEDFLWEVIGDVTGLTAAVDQTFEVYEAVTR